MITQPQRTDLVLLAPSAYSTDSIYKYSVEEYTRLIFHEVTYIFEEYLSPNIESIPRWCSEGLATYLSEQWKYEEGVRILVINGCKIKRVPDFNEIEKDVILSYQWGWTIIMFIESSYGKEMILKIVRECYNCNVFEIVGENIKILEKRRKEWLLKNWKSINFI